MRITTSHLRAKIERLNQLTNSPADYMTGGKCNIGNYHLSGAYGGWALHRTVNESGGVHDVFGLGHIPARQLVDMISAYMAGYQDARG